MDIESNNLYTDAELSLLKSTFADNQPLFKLMRKLFLPSQIDTTAEFPSFLDDLSMNKDFQIEGYPSMQQAMIGMGSRMKSIQYIESKLLQIWVLAGQKKETLEETKKRLSKDSSK